MKSLFVIYTLIFAFNTFANDKGGNGGDGVVCRNADQSIKSVELFDYYEARTLRNMKLETSSSQNLKVAVSELLTSLSSFSPIRSEEFREWAQSFEQETLFVDHDLEDIPDSGPVIFPSRCKIEQVIIQYNPDISGGRRFEVNRPIWEAASVATRAGFMLHEFLYREAIYRWKHRDSVLVRYFNSVVASPESQSQIRESAKSFYDFLILVKFGGFESKRIVFSMQDLDQRHFYPDGNFKGGFVASAKEKALLKNQKLTVSKRPYSYVGFMQNGKISTMTTDEVYHDDITNQDFTGTINLYDNGSIHYADIPETGFYEDPHTGLRYKGYIVFGEDGYVTTSEIGQELIEGKNFSIHYAPYSSRPRLHASTPTYWTVMSFGQVNGQLSLGSNRINVSYSRQLFISVFQGYFAGDIEVAQEEDSVLLYGDTQIPLLKGSLVKVGFYNSSVKNVSMRVTAGATTDCLDVKIGDQYLPLIGRYIPSMRGESTMEFSESITGEVRLENAYLCRETEVQTHNGLEKIPAGAKIYIKNNGVDSWISF
jgi:hypothetical protein